MTDTTHTPRSPSVKHCDADDVAVNHVEDFRFEAIRHLQPGLYAIHRELLAAFPDMAVRRIVEGRLPLVIGIQSEFSCLDMLVAARATIEWIAAGSATLTSPDVEIIVESGDIPLERRSIKQGLLHARIIVLIRSDAAPSVHDALLDARIDVAEIGLPSISATLEREYEPEAVPDLDHRPPGFTYEILDLACAKAATAQAAWDIVCSLGKGKEPESVSTVTSVPSLDTLSGYGEAMTWARDLQKDLLLYRAGTLSWSDLSTRALLVGPPGTGKTLFASAVARDLDLAFHATSYATWQRAGDGHLGDVMAEMARVFDEAARRPPSLVFIDEIDSLPTRSSVTRSSTWWRSVTNGLLEALDGSDRRAGVVVIGACNDASNLDPALVRSGRLERCLVIGLPDAQAFADILSHHLGGDLSAPALEEVARYAAGTLSGADAAQIARDARRIARNACRAVLVTDVEAVMFPRETRTADAVWRIAVHEAGHAVVALSSGIVPLRATLVTTARSSGSIVIDEDHRSITLACNLEADARIALGGRAAEVVVLGAPSTGSGGSSTSDLAMATELVRSSLSIFGFGRSLAYGGAVDRTDVDARLSRIYGDTVAIVSRHRSAVEALARLLVERRTLPQGDLRTFAREHYLQA